MLVWFAETTLIAILLAAAAALVGRWLRLGPVPRHMLWLVVLLKLVTPPLLAWPHVPSPRPAPAEMPIRPVVTIATETRAPVARDAPWGRPGVVRSAIGSSLPDLEGLARSALGAWAWISVALATGQIVRIMRFRRGLRWAVPAPDWLADEALCVGQSMNVRVPEILVVPGLSSPMIWFLGAPKLFLPAGLVESLGLAGWQGILAHELAHLRRRDHWIRRIELLAGLLWWWNPLYWLTCHRLEADAELACDEWATSLFPEGRIEFAEALLQVCQSQSMAGSPAPALGVAGSGRFLERRVTMILHEQSPSRASAGVLLTVLLLAFLAFPSWSTSSETKAVAPEAPANLASSTAVIDDDSDDDDDRDDDDDDRDDEKKPAKAKAKDKPANDDDEQKPVKGKPKTAAKKEKADDGPALDPRELKKLEQLSKELEAKFGPGSEFQKEMEKLGPLMESKFGPGSEFAKEMEAKFGPGSKFSKEIESKFGPGSKFSKEIESKFGPGSDFEKQMKEKFGPGSEFETKMKKFGADAEARSKKPAEALVKSKKAAEAASKARIDKKKTLVDTSREKDQEKSRRIERLQAQIEKLRAELQAIKAEDDDK